MANVIFSWINELWWYVNLLLLRASRLEVFYKGFLAKLKKKNQKVQNKEEPPPKLGFLELVRGAYVALPHCTASVLSLFPLVGVSMKPNTISSLGVSVSLWSNLLSHRSVSQTPATPSAHLLHRLSGSVLSLGPSRLSHRVLSLAPSRRPIFSVVSLDDSVVCLIPLSPWSRGLCRWLRRLSHPFFSVGSSSLWDRRLSRSVVSLAPSSFSLGLLSRSRV